MNRILVGSLFLALLSATPALSQHGTIGGNETLFTVMAAINAAGYDADVASPSNHPLRNQIRQQLAARHLRSIERLKLFYAAHKQADPVADLGQYISFALLVNGPPEFRFRSLRYELPPDAQRLAGLGPLLGQFYREAGIHTLYEKAQPAFDEVIRRYHREVVRTLFEVNGYLRNPTSGVTGRSFQIIISLLAAPNQVQTRSYSGNYFVIITPSPQLRISDIRYSYLQYVLEPVATRFAAKLEKKKALGDYALGAPFLPEYYKHDFLLLATTSLVKAIEARLAPVPPAEKQKMVNRAWRLGYILTPYFAEQLPAYEKQNRAMRFYFGSMVDNINLSTEEARTQKLEFLQKAPVQIVKRPPAPVRKASPAELALQEAGELYRGHKLQQAREAYLRVLRATDDKPLQAKAYYGLARIAALRNQPELAESLFKKTLQSSPGDREKAWALAYLGRLSDIAGRAKEAARYYQAALAVKGASGKAHEMAMKGASGAFRRGRHP